jgi:hypothetical protein
MLSRLFAFFRRPAQSGRSDTPPADPVSDTSGESAAATPVGMPYDEHLFERARTQWQFGDWSSLASMDVDVLKFHPERAKLALLSAAGHSQLGAQEEARQRVRLAMSWGCSRRLVAQVLAAGVHNSLGRAAASAGMAPRALEHLRSAVALGTPGADLRLMAQARVDEQYRQIGLPAPQPNAAEEKLTAVR